MAFKGLSKIDNKTKYTVCGWIRNNEQTLKLNHIPLLISSICILYFRDDEIFALIGTKVKLSNNKKCIEKIANEDDYHNCSYGINEISSKDNIVCQWDLKINKISGSTDSNTHNVMIGISSKQGHPDRF
eukprot:62690_1